MSSIESKPKSTSGIAKSAALGCITFLVSYDWAKDKVRPSSQGRLYLCTCIVRPLPSDLKDRKKRWALKSASGYSKFIERAAHRQCRGASSYDQAALVFREQELVMNSTQSLRVAVIGAGASGLCIAKHLIEAGVDVTVFEIGSQIGGQWVYNNDSGKSPAYRTLHINSPKSLTAFPDFPFPEKTQLFPSHWDMHKYLVAYADKFGVTPRIRLRSEVKALRPL